MSKKLLEGQNDCPHCGQDFQIILKALNDTSDNATQNFLLYQYIQMLKDPDSNVKFVVVPANGTPLILNTDEKSG
jgi:hypothetical protein